VRDLGKHGKRDVMIGRAGETRITQVSRGSRRRERRYGCASLRRHDGTVTRSIDQLVAAWRLLCGRGPRHVLASGEGVDYAFSGLPVPFLNLAAVTARDVTAWRCSTQPTPAARSTSAWGSP
jgi:hypothetical protein